MERGEGGREMRKNRVGGGERERERRGQRKGKEQRRKKEGGRKEKRRKKGGGGKDRGRMGQVESCKLISESITTLQHIQIIFSAKFINKLHSFQLKKEGKKL